MTTQYTNLCVARQLQNSRGAAYFAQLLCAIAVVTAWTILANGYQRHRGHQHVSLG